MRARDLIESADDGLESALDYLQYAGATITGERDTGRDLVVELGHMRAVVDESDCSVGVEWRGNDVGSLFMERNGTPTLGEMLVRAFRYGDALREIEAILWRDLSEPNMSRYAYAKIPPFKRRPRRDQEGLSDRAPQPVSVMVRCWTGVLEVSFATEIGHSSRMIPYDSLGEVAPWVEENLRGWIPTQRLDEDVDWLVVAEDSLEDSGWTRSRLLMEDLRGIGEDLEDNGYVVEMGDDGVIDQVIFYPPDRPWERCQLLKLRNHDADKRVTASLAPSLLGRWTNCHPSEIGEFIRSSAQRIGDWPLRVAMEAGWTYAAFSNDTSSVTLTRPGRVGIADGNKISITTTGHDRFTWESWAVTDVLAALTEGSAAVAEMRTNWELLASRLKHDGESSPSTGFFACGDRFIKLVRDTRFRTGRIGGSNRLSLPRLVRLALADGWPPAR